MKIEFIDFGIDDVCKLPLRKRPVGDCGYDCFARETVTIPAHGAAKVPLGFGMIIPEGYTAYMHNRGGTFLRGISVGDALIDLNYRGEIHALLQNITDEDITIERGERPCSMVLTPNIDIDWLSKEEADNVRILLNGEERGTNGFNSSGK